MPTPETVVTAANELPTLRVMALPALAYCERLFYLEEVEEIRLADELIYAGRQLHERLAEAEENLTLELTSLKYGLTGIMDALRQQDGKLIPYEHKRGKAARGTDGKPEAWPADRLQVGAYALMLEDCHEITIEEGRIRYHAANTTIRVPIDDALRQDVAAAIARANELRQSLERPPVTENERLCVRCSLAPACLPEESRLATEADYEPKRLFPPHRDGSTLHVVTAGAKVKAAAETLQVTLLDGTSVKQPIRQIEAVCLHGMAQISTQALRLCHEHGVAVHWLGQSGHHYGSITPSAGQVQRRLRQYQAMTDPEIRLRLARTLATAKVASQLAYLMRLTRSRDEARQEVESALEQIRDRLRDIDKATSADSLRGYEGAAANQYFSALRLALNDDVDEQMRPDGRSRRPPRDRFNALLSFGYGLLHTKVMGAVLASGLEPALGFFHTPRSAAYPLVLDLMELFRVLLWDMPLIGSIHRKQWDLEQDFTVTKAKVWLTEDGRRKAVRLFEARLDETWKHPVLNYSLSYARTIELEARLLEKEWTGEPGLFAQSRLR